MPQVMKLNNSPGGIPQIGCSTSANSLQQALPPAGSDSRSDPVFSRPPLDQPCIDVRMAQKCVFVIGITCQMVAFGDDENVGGGIPSPKTTPASQTTTIRDHSTWPWGGRGQALTAPRAFNSKRGRARS